LEGALSLLPFCTVCHCCYVVLIRRENSVVAFVTLETKTQMPVKTKPSLSSEDNDVQ
jgi:hypothetical protein